MDIKKIIAKLPTGWAEDVAGFDAGQLKAAILQSEVNIRTVETERDADERLSGAKELLKDLSGPYRDAVGAQRAKIAYALHVLEERGELLARD